MERALSPLPIRGARTPRLDAVIRQVRVELAMLRSDPTSGGADLLLWRLGVPGALVEPGLDKDAHRQMLGTVTQALGWVLVAFGVLVVAGAQTSAPTWLTGWLQLPWPATPWGIGLVVLVIQLGMAGRTTLVARKRARCERTLAAAEAELTEPLAGLRATAGRSGRVDAGVGLLDAIDRLVSALPAAGPAAVERNSAPAPMVELAEVTIDAANEVRRAVAEAVAQLERTAVLAERDADHSQFLEAGERPIVTAAERIEVAAASMADATGALLESVRSMEAAMDRAHWLELVVDGLRHDQAHGDDLPDADPG